jgi:hypothetical protein
VQHHIAVPGQRGTLAHIGDEADAARRRLVRDPVGQDEDRNAAVVIALPAARQLVGATARDDLAGGEHLGEHLAARSRVVAPVEPVEAAEPVDAHRRVDAVLRPDDEAVHGHGHVEPDQRHRSARRSHAVAEVRHTRPVEVAEKPELDVIGRHVLEQPPPLPEQHGDQLQLHLVEQAGAAARLRCRCAVHEDVAAASRGLRLCDARGRRSRVGRFQTSISAISRTRAARCRSSSSAGNFRAGEPRAHESGQLVVTLSAVILTATHCGFGPANPGYGPPVYL